MSVMAFTSCAHDHDHPHGEDEHSHAAATETDDHLHEKVIHLNEAQYNYTGIDTGWFEMKNLSDVIHANGYTKLDPQDQAEVSLPIKATIKSIAVIPGDYVKKGQVLATAFSIDYNQMRMQKSRLEEIQLKLPHNIAYLQAEYERQVALNADSINATRLLQMTEAELKGEQATLTAVNNQINILTQSLSAISKTSSPLINITAPISGYITAVNVKIGSLASIGELLFSLVDNSKMHVDLLVYEKDLTKVSVGQGVRFILTNQSNKEIKGKIYNIGKSFENDTKSVAVHADIEENDAKLIPGMYLNAMIDIGTEKVEALPNEAIVLAEGRNFIFLWEKENLDRELKNDHGESEITFVRLEVKTGASQLGYTEVTPLGQIHEGDKIVTKGAYYLQSHLQKSESGGEHHH
jgi:cobalt-zinc-cadmium efflux system membrane fusion protein